MRKRRIERNLAFPSEEFRAKVRTGAKQRGYRTEQAFILAACENELKRDARTDADSQMEARLIASMQKVAKEFQALFTLVHAQFALTNSLLQSIRGALARWARPASSTTMPPTSYCFRPRRSRTFPSPMKHRSSACPLVK